MRFVDSIKNGLRGRWGRCAQSGPTGQMGRAGLP